MQSALPIMEADNCRRESTFWLALATCAVAVSGAFAILIALARVPALGNLFPGTEFYRVALALHVNFSQGVWFMAFAGVLWSLSIPRPPGGIDRLAWLSATWGAIGMAVSLLIGQPKPLMSNYLPVLDSPLFLSALSLFGVGIVLKTAGYLALARPPAMAGRKDVQCLALFAAAVETLVALGLVIAAAINIQGRLEGHAYFETLFWGGGHVWQFALVSLLMYCWLELEPLGVRKLPAGNLGAIVLFGASPVVLAAAVPFLHAPDTGAYADAYTWLMQWTSWEAPLLLGVLLWFRRGEARTPGFGLSLLLFIAGLLLGASINGQTTLVTAHYHGTIGAVTLAFMATSFVLLPRLGIEPPRKSSVRLQLGLYGYGILLMMAGLAGAGLMGAPRKTPGDLGLSWSVETISRMCLGIGGVLATLGILMFAVLLIRRIFTMSQMAMCPR